MVDSGVSIVFSTIPSEEIGGNLAHEIVKAGLCACVNIIPKVRSIYRWKGEIHDDAEALLIMKTATASVARLIDFVRVHHPYEVPEIIAFGIDEGNSDYIDWVMENSAGR